MATEQLLTTAESKQCCRRMGLGVAVIAWTCAAILSCGVGCQPSRHVELASPPPHRTVAGQRAADEYLALLFEKAAEIRNERPQDPQMWWNHTLEGCFGRILEIACVHGAEPLGELFADEWGQHGPIVDLLLLYGGARLFAEHSDHPPDLDALTGFESSPSAQRALKWYEWEATVARAQVLRFCEAPELFERYYRALMWSSIPFGQSNTGHRNEGEPAPPLNGSFDEFQRACNRLHQGFPRHSSTDDRFYWRYARQFMFLAKASNRDDLLKDLTPECIYARFREWDEWIMPRLSYLVPHGAEPVWIQCAPLAMGVSWATQDYVRPELPCPDWDLAVPLFEPSYLGSAVAAQFLFADIEACEGVLPGP